MSIRQIGVWLFGLALLGSSVGAIRMWTDTSSLRLRDVGLDPESYAVYDAVLPLSFDGHPMLPHLIVPQTVSNADLQGQPGKCFPPDVAREYGAAFTTFVLRNRAPRTLERKLSPTLPYGYVDGRHSVDHDVRLSAVGFDEHHTHAVVHMADYCGPLCGGGQYYLLEKRDGRWIVADGPDWCGWNGCVSEIRTGSTRAGSRRDP
jgi:hypothetical protein